MGGAAPPPHAPGNHRSVERASNLQAARRGGLMKPAKPAGERENTAALTPSLGTRSSGARMSGANLVSASLENCCLPKADLEFVLMAEARCGAPACMRPDMSGAQLDIRTEEAYLARYLWALLKGVVQQQTNDRTTIWQQIQ